MIASVDCFEDDADDIFVAPNEVPSPAELLALTAEHRSKAASSASGPGQGQGLGQSAGHLSLPAVAHDSAVVAARALLQPGIKPRERVSFFVLGAVFDLVVTLLTALAERRIAKPEAEASATESLALEILSVISGSEFKALLNQYFCRVMIAKAGIRAKLSAQIFLNK